MNRTLLRRDLFYGILILVFVALDQAVKFVCTKYLAPDGSVQVIPGILDLHYCENRGAAFSLFSGQVWPLIVLTAALVLFFGFYLFTGRVRRGVASVSVALILAGGLGNLLDRCVYGFVVDMFEFKFIRFAIFNVADILITCSTVVFICCYAFSKKEVVQWSLSRKKKTPDGE